MPDLNTGPDDRTAERWREAAELRENNHGWIVLWLEAENLFRAYRNTWNYVEVEAPTAPELQEKITANPPPHAKPAISL
jgi:hypothetical protein